MIPSSRRLPSRASTPAWMWRCCRTAFTSSPRTDSAVRPHHGPLLQERGGTFAADLRCGRLDLPDQLSRTRNRARRRSLLGEGKQAREDVHQAVQVPVAAVSKDLETAGGFCRRLDCRREFLGSPLKLPSLIPVSL
jgi:hypothetical protein